jgi:hypothetical protein
MATPAQAIRRMTIAAEGRFDRGVPQQLGEAEQVIAERVATQHDLDALPDDEDRGEGQE